MRGGIVVDKLTSALVRSGPGPITTVPKVTVTSSLDAAGSVALSMPTTDQRAALIAPNQLNYVRVVPDGDTSDMRNVGILIERTRHSVTRELQLRGPNLLHELTFTNVGKLTLESTPGSGLPMAKADILDAILDGTGWTVDPAFDTPSRDVYHKFGDEKTLLALSKLAELTGDHWRMSRTEPRQIQWLAAGADGYVPAESGLIAKEAYDSSEDACLIDGGLTVIEDGNERITRIYPRGGGNADAQLYINATTLFGAPGNTPGDYVDGDYTLHIDTDPAKSYIKHTVNDAAGSIGDVETIRDIAPLSDTATDEQSAANELVQRAMVTLRRRLSDQRSFRFRLRHVDLDRLREGDSIRLRARYYTDGYCWMDIDEDVLILELPVTFGADEPVVDIQVTSIENDRWPAGGGAPVQLTAGAVHEIVRTMSRLQDTASHIQPAVRAQSAEAATTIPDGSVTPAKLSSAVYVLDRDLTAATVANSAAETSVYSVTVPGGTLGTTRALRVRVFGTVLNNTGATQTLRLRVKYDGTTVFDVTTGAMAANASARGIRGECHLLAAGATNAQVADGWFLLSAPNATNGATTGGATAQQATHPSVAVDSTTAQTLEITAQLSTASANLTTTILAVVVEAVK